MATHNSRKAISTTSALTVKELRSLAVGMPASINHKPLIIQWLQLYRYNELQKAIDNKRKGY